MLPSEVWRRAVQNYVPVKVRSYPEQTLTQAVIRPNVGRQPAYSVEKLVAEAAIVVAIYSIRAF